MRVTLIDRHGHLLPFVDREIIDALIYHLRDTGAAAYLGESVSGVAPIETDHGARVRIDLALTPVTELSEAPC